MNTDKTHWPPAWWLRLEDRLAFVAGKLQHQHRRWFAWFGVALVCLALVWIWMPVWWPHNPHREALETAWWRAPRAWISIVLALSAVGMVLAFLLVASSFKTLKEKLDEKLAEKLDHDIAQLSSDLTQSNLNVGALHMQMHDERHSPAVPEHVLRAMDDGLRIKDALASLEKVIQARQRNVQNQLNHFKEERQRARRAVTAAAGGMVVGYFTYEVGESVLKYIHVTHWADDRDLQYWLHADPKGKQLQQGQSISGRDIVSYYDKEFHHHELAGQAWLLTSILLVSLLAGWLGWRKPPEEQAGGHGGHH